MAALGAEFSDAPGASDPRELADAIAAADVPDAGNAPEPGLPVLDEALVESTTDVRLDTPAAAEPRLTPPTAAIPAQVAAPVPEVPRSGPGGPGPGWPMRPPNRPREGVADGASSGVGAAASSDSGLDRGATAPQLRRFIKSRAYVPMHELRRRFGINGNDDDVIPIDIDRQRVYVGLPPREGGLLGELLRAGDIGYELSLDPIAPIVVGVYPMRPVPRS